MHKQIYYHQTNDQYDLNSDELFLGFNDLGYKIHSNIQSYPFINTNNIDNCIRLVSTSANDECPAIEFPKPYYYLDGRDRDEINKFHLDRCSLYFMSNLAEEYTPNTKIKFLPFCVENSQIKHLKNVTRDIDVSFITGHLTNGRDLITQWVNNFKNKYSQYKIFNSSIWTNLITINPHYTKHYTNIVSLDYFDLLNRSKISINAPGGNGGVNTKRFYEILAAGCVCLNYVPLNYPQKLNNILNIIPNDINCPKDLICNFSSESELHKILNNIIPLYYENGIDKLTNKTKEWALNWTCKDKALYIMKNIEDLNV